MPVVGSDTVDVMHFFLGSEWATEDSRHDVAMLKDVFTVNGDDAVTLRVEPPHAETSDPKVLGAVARPPPDFVDPLIVCEGTPEMSLHQYPMGEFEFAPDLDVLVPTVFLRAAGAALGSELGQRVPVGLVGVPMLVAKLALVDAFRAIQGAFGDAR